MKGGGGRRGRRGRREREEIYSLVKKYFSYLKLSSGDN